jgi:hypothetical protein
MPQLDTPLAKAAEKVGVSPSWLHSLINRRIIHGDKRGRDVFVSLSQIQEYKTWIDGLTDEQKSGLRYPEQDGMKVWPVESEPVQ